MKKKVFLFIPTIGGGGAEKMVIDLAAGIDGSKYDVTLFSLYDKSRANPERVQYAESKGVNIRYLNKKSGFDIKLLNRLAKLIKAENPDVLHSHLESFQYISVIGRLMHKKHIHTMHSVGGKEHKVYGFLLKHAYRNPQFVMVALSSRIHDELSDMYPKLKERLVTIFNGIDVIHFHSEKNRVNSDSIELICVANLTPVKNHEMLIKSIWDVMNHINKSIHLTLVGDGVLRDELEKLVQSSGLEHQISFVGSVPDPAPLLKKADAFVMSSHYEGMPLSVAEAMAAGLPIIAPQVGGLNEMVDGNGILYEVDNQNALSKAIINLIDNNDLWDQYHMASISRAGMFDVSEMVKKYEQLYD